MQHIFSRQTLPDLARAQEGCFLLTNGLGGYASLSTAFSMTRADQGLLISAVTPPNVRRGLLARMEEQITCGGGAWHLSTQDFAGDAPAEEGWRSLSSFAAGDVPCWVYERRGVRVQREVAMAQGVNAVALRYTISNRSSEACTLTLRPWVLGFEKGHAPLQPWKVRVEGDRICTGEGEVCLQGSDALVPEEVRHVMQAYRHDAPDGRPEKGLVASAGCIRRTVAAGECATVWLVASDVPCALTAAEIISAQSARREALRRASGLQDVVARELVCAADAFIVDRASTGGKSIIAGYPFFADWGRDTMIALPGCCLSTRRYEDAKSIMRTFLANERDGLMPNLFPEGGNEPMYNTVDAALLLINTVWLYVQDTGDLPFAREAWPVMARIVEKYRSGTRHGIRMDADGLITAGGGFDQVTWMDVRIGDILPTPRHGKPVEINACWYSALMVMDALASLLGESAADYAALAGQVKTSFRAAFVRADGCGLRDLVSGTAADEQIRCNQIWAVTQPFTMLTHDEARAVVDTVYAHLYTPCGLRTLSPEDAQYHPVYAGHQKERDMAYHQGTVWPFPLGAYYLAYLKVHGGTKAAAQEVRQAMLPMEAILREGCVGQIPEIYDGETPALSRGCFAQAWSVGEILRVYSVLERIENA